jgi:hypothetical protein
MKPTNQMSKLIFLSLVVFCQNTFAQTTFSEKVEAVKKQQNIWINNAKPNSIPDSFAAISAKKYIAVLDSIKAICNNSQKMESTYSADELWKNGAWKESSIENRNNLLQYISLMKDSVLFDFLQKQNSTTYVPAKQTECCAIPDGYAANMETFTKLHPQIIAALSTSNAYKNKNNGAGSKVFSAICSGITMQMEANDYEASYNKYKDLLPQNIDPEMEAKVKEIRAKQENKKQPIWIWLLGGFVLAVILFFIIGKKNKNV